MAKGKENKEIIAWKKAIYDPESSKGIVKQVEESESVTRFNMHKEKCKRYFEQWRQKP